MRWRRTALVGALVVVAGLLAGCGSEEPAQGGLRPSSVEVDTPRLRSLKERLGMENCPRAQSPAADEGLPALTLPCLGGGRDVDMASLRGPLVLNLWQSFCGPCIKEMPALQVFHEQHGERVAILGIDYQDTRPEAALELARKTGVTYPSVADPGGDLNGRDGFPLLRGLPYLVLVDADGRIAHVRAGGIEEASELVDMVETHLGVRL